MEKEHWIVTCQWGSRAVITTEVIELHQTEYFLLPSLEGNAPVLFAMPITNKQYYAFIG